MFVRSACALASLCILVIASPALGQDEVPLFNGEGEAAAYIADDFTIYLWEGEPVAYLTPASDGVFHLYGFNGQHLGWFTRGAVWGSDGDAACAVREALRRPPQIAPVKGIKEIKPIKAIKELAPIAPIFTNSFGATPCEKLLKEGAE